MRFWSVIQGVNHLSMSKLNLKFKIFSNFLVGKYEGGINHLSVSRINLKFKIYSWVTGQCNIAGGQSSFHVQAEIFNLKFISEITGQWYWSCQTSCLVQPKSSNLKFSVRFWLVQQCRVGSIIIHKILHLQWDSGWQQWGSQSSFHFKATS